MTTVRSLDGLVLIETEDIAKLHLVYLVENAPNKKHLPRIELLAQGLYLSPYYSDLSGLFHQAWQDYKFIMDRYDKDPKIWLSRIPKSTLLGLTCHYIYDSSPGFVIDFCQDNFGVDNQGNLIFRDPIRERF